MAKKKNAFEATIAYTYYCEKCSKFFKYILDFDDRLKPYGCHYCLTPLKYKGGTDIRQSSRKIDYKSAEKQSAENIKNLSADERYKLEHETLVGKRTDAWKETNKHRWWKDYCPDPDKPLDLSKIKDVQKFIDTGDIT